MPLSTNTTYRIYVEKLGDTNPVSFVGDAGEVFYDPFNPVLKLSDGSTLGGLSFSGGNSGSSFQWVTTSSGIHTTSNVGIGTTNPTARLTVSGNVNVIGIVTTTSFVGSGTSLTNLPIIDPVIASFIF